MSAFEKWCDELEKTVNGEDLTLLTTDEARVEIGENEVARVVPGHYACEQRIAGILSRLGKVAAADYVATKLPTTTKARSGDVGEILATSYIEQNTIWDESIMKLRWKDSREMPLRGDDMLAVGIGDEDRLQFLKGESKSREKLSKSPITDARRALNHYDGRPTPHSLSFLADRMAEAGRTEISDRIDAAMLSDGIQTAQLTHMIFTFSGNDPERTLTTDLAGYKGDIDQWSVGLRVGSHQDFIRKVFDKVLADGDT